MNQVYPPPNTPTAPTARPGAPNDAPRQIAMMRRRLVARRKIVEHTITIPGAAREYTVAVPADPNAVLDELAAPEPHMPYWATLWPSGLALAEVALTRRGRLAGQTVLEVGCGLGVTATAAVEVGALLTVADCFAETLAFCRYNALRNTGYTPTGRLADWRTEEGRTALRRAGPFGMVLAADVLYEREDIEPLLTLVTELVGGGSGSASGGKTKGEFWLAEPGRETSTAFVARAHGAGWRGEMDERERIWPAGAGYANVRVHTLRLE